MNSRMFFSQFACVVLVLSFQVNGDDWPQWRGPKLNSVSDEAKLPDAFSRESGMLWRTALPGPAGSSPVVWEDQVYVTSVEGRENGANMSLLCFGTDGELRWKRELAGRNTNSRDGANSASPSPSTDGQHVWAMMSNGVLHCFTVAGELVWKKDLQNEYGQFNIQFGMATTPILDKGRLYLALIHGDMRDMKATSVGHVVALDAKTGKEIWHQKRETDAVSENTHSYASPVVYRDDEREFLITHGADYVIGHSLEDGSELWRCGGINHKGSDYNPYLRFVSSPCCQEGIIIVPSAKRRSVLALKPNLTGDVTEQSENFHWRRAGGTPDVASPVIYQGLIYLADEKGVLVCVDAETGKTLYEQRLFASKHRSTPVAADGKIFITGRDGQVYVVKAGREFELISKTDLEEETTASPAIANGRIFVRTFDALYAFGE
jgi:outer membrane protein assembly factor BamB